MSRSDTQQRTPADLLLSLITGYYVSSAIHAATALGIPDLLADGPVGHEEIASATGSHPESLRRLLRLLASAGVFVERLDGTFELSSLGACLRSDAPRSMRSVALLFAAPWQQQTWTDLLYSIRTGSSAFEHARHTGVFSFLEQHPEDATVFNEAMAFFAGEIGAAIVEGTYDLSRFGTVVDVGGGDGSLLASMLEANPRMSGVLFDRPAVAVEARRRIADRGLSERCTVVAGDFFVDPVPAGAEAYLLKDVLSDYDDEHAVQILENCRSALPSKGVVLIVASVLPDRVKTSWDHLRYTGSDLNMLVHLAGRERSEHDFRQLVRAAGLDMRRIVDVGDTPSGIAAPPSIMEAVRA